MADDNSKLLSDAIARNTAAVLSLPSAGMLRHLKSRFVSDRGELVWLESSRDEHLLVDELIKSQQLCGVSFRVGVEKISFASRVVRRESEFRVNETISVEAVALAIPEKIRAVQRRSNYRVNVLGNDEIKLRVWRMNDAQVLKDVPADTVEVLAEAVDLSVGGAGVVFRGVEGNAPKISEADRLRLEFVYKGRATLIEGRMIHPTPIHNDPTRVRAGLQFLGLQDGIAGRQITSDLTRIVGELQRDEVKRARRMKAA